MWLTAALAGDGVLLAGPRLEYLAPLWPVIVTDYGATIILHLGLAFAAVAPAFAGLTHAAALADLGRSGEGDPQLARALRRDA